MQLVGAPGGENQIVFINKLNMVFCSILNYCPILRKPDFQPHPTLSQSDFQYTRNPRWLPPLERDPPAQRKKERTCPGKSRKQMQPLECRGMRNNFHQGRMGGSLFSSSKHSLGDIHAHKTLYCHLQISHGKYRPWQQVWVKVHQVFNGWQQRTPNELEKARRRRKKSMEFWGT